VLYSVQHWRSIATCAAALNYSLESSPDQHGQGKLSQTRSVVTIGNTIFQCCIPPGSQPAQHEEGKPSGTRYDVAIWQHKILMLYSSRVTSNLIILVAHWLLWFYVNTVCVYWFLKVFYLYFCNAWNYLHILFNLLTPVSMLGQMLWVERLLSIISCWSAPIIIVVIIDCGCTVSYLPCRVAKRTVVMVIWCIGDLYKE